MKCHYACQSGEHVIERRRFLGTLAGAAGAATFGMPRLVSAAMGELAANQKHILIIWLSGGLSQLESWDPKPKTDTGGPFRAIPTSVPGTHISELLPYSAKQVHRLAIVRSINTKENDHGKGAYCMTTGRRQEPVADYPHLGAVGARLLAPRIRRYRDTFTFRPGPAEARPTTRPSSDRAMPAFRWVAARRKTRPGPRAFPKKRTSNATSCGCGPTNILPGVGARPTATPSLRRSSRPSS